jgi:hypothetical protein
LEGLMLAADSAPSTQTPSMKLLCKSLMLRSLRGAGFAGARFS